VTVLQGGAAFGLEPCNTTVSVLVNIPNETGSGPQTYTFAMSPDVIGHGGDFPDSKAVVVQQLGL
jgi:hypothetical protein